MRHDKAITFIRQRGNNLDLLRLRRALGEPFSHAEAEGVLSPYQFPDGSWDYNPPEENADRIGSLGGTIHCLRWVREFGLGHSVLLAHTLEFLSRIQGADGSFYETEAKLAHSPHSWLQEDTLIDRFYFTEAVLMRLFSLGCREHAVVEPAVTWLRQHVMDWEIVAGTWYNVWALLCIAKAVGMNMYERCYTTALKWLPRLEAQPLTWFLDALHAAGFTLEERLVAEGIARLEAMQNAEGVWSDPSSPVEATITALRVLRDYGVW